MRTKETTLTNRAEWKQPKEQGLDWLDYFFLLFYFFYFKVIDKGDNFYFNKILLSFLPCCFILQSNHLSEPDNIIKILVFRPFPLQEKEKTNSGYKHNKQVSNGKLNLTFRMLQHTSSEVTVTKYDKI